MHIGIRRTCLCTAVSRTQIGELIKPAIEGHQLNSKLTASYKARNVFALHSTQAILCISVLRSSTPHTAAQECASCAQYAHTMNKRATKYRCNCRYGMHKKKTRNLHIHKEPTQGHSQHIFPYTHMTHSLRSIQNTSAYAPHTQRCSRMNRHRQNTTKKS